MSPPPQRPSALDVVQDLLEILAQQRGVKLTIELRGITDG